MSYEESNMRFTTHERKIIGLNAKRLRVLARVTQEELCQRLSWAHATQSRIETGSMKHLTLGHVSVLATVLGTTVAELCDESKANSAVVTIARKIAGMPTATPPTPINDTLATRIAALDSESQALIELLVEKLRRL